MSQFKTMPLFFFLLSAVWQIRNSDKRTKGGLEKNEVDDCDKKE